MNYFRKKIYEETFEMEETDIGKIYMAESDVKNLVDEIEDRVHEIKEALKPYAVFEELKEVLEMIEKLETDLY